jgi:large subunit ribosomal protein L21
MKKAVIQTGGKQYLVSEGELLSVELLKDVKGGKVSFDALLVIDGDTTKVGTPTVAGSTVKADVVSEDEQENKVTSIRYKAKKRVHTVRGHRQHKTIIKIAQIS